MNFEENLAYSDKASSLDRKLGACELFE